MKILFLSAWFPYPPINGARLRIFNLLSGLSAAHQVTLITYAEQAGQTGQPGQSGHPGQAGPAIPPELSALCERVIAIPARPYRPSSLRALAGLFSPRPRVLVDRYLPEMAAAIRHELHGGRYDLVVASQWYTADYLLDLPAGVLAGVPALLEEIEMGVFADAAYRAPNLLSRLRSQMTYAKMRAYFRRLLPRFAAATVASEVERGLLKQLSLGYDAFHVIPNGVWLEQYAPFRAAQRQKTLIFTGAFSFPANYEAMRWFNEEVYPLVRAEEPGVRLQITGDPAGRTLPNMEGVELLGFVDDVRPLLGQAAVSLAPLKTGGGTRLKILEAMASGTPVVATSKGAEGLQAEPGVHFLQADDPAEFAAAILRLLRHGELARQVSRRALSLVAEKYDWQVILPRFLALAEAAAAGKRPQPSAGAAIALAGRRERAS